MLLKPYDRRQIVTFIFLITAVLFWTANNPVFAADSVVINEFCPACDPEWVELYNTGPDQVILDNWQLTDGNTKTTDDIVLSGIIQPNSFIVFEHVKGWLNDSSPGDSVTLTDNTENPPIDNYSYTTTINNKTFSRIPDGTGSFATNTEPTRNVVNQPPPTPTPTPTLTPTATPAPTSTTSPTQSPTPSPKPTSTPRPTTVPTSQPTPKPSIVFGNSDNENSISGNEDLPEIDLAIKDAMSPAPTNEPEVLGTDSTKTSKPSLPIILIIAGTLLTLAGGVLLAYQEIKKNVA